MTTSSIYMKKSSVPLLALWHCFGFWMALKTDASTVPPNLLLKVQSRTYPEHGHLGTLVRHIVGTYMPNCNLWIVKGGRDSQVFADVWRALSDAYKISGIFDLSKANSQNEVPFQWPGSVEEKETCRVFVCDLTGNEAPNIVTEFLDRINLFLIPNAFVVFLGPKPFLDNTLRDRSLRNTASVLYLMIAHSKGKKDSHPIPVYSRCLYCNSGQPKIELVDVWRSTSGSMMKSPLLRDQFGNMGGHKLRIVQLGWYPLVAYTMDSDELSTTVTPIDTLHVRVLRAIANSLNFTYEMRVPWDCQWGISTTSGNWTGIIGTLQHHKADFGMSITYNIGRMKVVDYTRIFLKEPVVMVMSKPRPPPQYLAIIHPLTANLWAAVLVSSMSAGLILWGLQLGWKKASGKKGLTIDVSFLYTWSILFEEPATKLPTNTSSLIFLAFWWIYCTLITVTYKSSLIAHLSVPGKSKAIDSLDEMLEDGTWTWGFGDNHTGTYELFRKSDSSVIRRVFQGMQIQPNEKQVERILSERHVLLIKEFLFKSLKATIARNRGGATPFYYGKSEYFANGDGWAFRQNAPFYNAIDLKLQQLTETGHITHWLNQLIGTSLEEPCESQQCKEEEVLNVAEQDRSDQVVLSLSHLQSAFYLLALGILFASLAFAGENVVHMIL